MSCAAVAPILSLRFSLPREGFPAGGADGYCPGENALAAQRDPRSPGMRRAARAVAAVIALRWWYRHRTS